MATVTIDPIECQVQVDGTVVNLGINEYRLIEELSISPLTGVSYSRIAWTLGQIRGPVTTNQVKATAASARRKLRAAGLANPLPEIAGTGLRLTH